MVMEEPPSPKSVGQEFVRQYYTLLNKAPIHLHRFYNNASSFIHGGLDASDREIEPVIGQKEIHNRIQQLNFRDCHAKITQVDSQATLGNGVVVQVTGELSNGGQPMRRFTQTFVLASQTPRQYYVHNDIFRYQDFVFSEEDGGGGGEWGYAAAGARADEPPPQQPPPAALPTPYFPPPPAVVPAVAAPVVPPTAAAPAPVPNQQQPPPMHQEHATHNGHQEDAGNHSMPMAVNESSCDVDLGAQEYEKEPEPAPFASATPVHEPAPVVVSEPKTYANLVKSGQTSSHYVNNQSASNVSARVTTSMPRSEASVASSPSVSTTPAAAQHRPRPTRTPRDDVKSDSPGMLGSGISQSASAGPGRRYSDSQQLFLGNLPHSATKDELRAIFERFGAIVDLKVYSKTPPGPGAPNNANNANNGRIVPHYAFLTFEDPQSAQNCLNSGQLYYPSNDSPDAIPLNVQEKKSRVPTGGGGGRGGATLGGGGGGMRMQRTPGGSFNRRPYQPQRR